MSGVVAVAAAGLTAGTVPKLIVGFHLPDFWLLGIALAAALLSRAAVLFGLFPLLSALHLSQGISAAYNLAITWGGLRGAVTLVLALSVTEDTRVDPALKDLIAVLETGFVLFTLLVNGLTLRPVMRLLKLDRLSPLDRALRDKVLTLSLRDVRDAVRQTADEYEISAAATAAATARYGEEIDRLAAESDFETAISASERMTIGLVAIANQERRIILEHHAQHTASGLAIERLLRNTNRLLDAAKAEGQAGYTRAAHKVLRFSRGFRLANFLHRILHLDGPLQHQISLRFETLLVRRLALGEFGRFSRSRLRALLGDKVCEALGELIAARLAATTRALDALRLQYPEHAEVLERRFLQQSGLRLLISRYRDLHEEGLIDREVFENLERGHAGHRSSWVDNAPLDLGLRAEELIGQFDMFAALGPVERKALTRRLRSRLLFPEETVIRKGERGTEMFLISSGAVEVVLDDQRVRLGSGDFFGEMALLNRGRRQADVIALGYCRVLVLSVTEFRRFLREYPEAKAEIDRVAAARARENAKHAAK